MISKARASTPTGAIGRNALALALLFQAVTVTACTRTEAPSQDTAATPKATTAATAAPPAQRAPEVVRQPEQLQIGFGRREATGITLQGWSKRNDDGRDVARVSPSKSSIVFDLTPLSKDYVLAAVARSEGTKPTTLTPTLNGQSLPAWSATNTWGIHVSPVPAAALSAGRAELVLTATGSQPADTTSVDSLALVPVTDRATVEMNGLGSGLLIDGFYGHEGGALRWSRGGKSVLGVVLRPSQAPYRLKVRGAAFPPLAPLAVVAKLNGKDLGSATFQSKRGDVIWDIPAGALSDGLNRVELVYARTGKPSAFGKSKDSRDIAVRFTRVSVEPR